MKFYILRSRVGSYSCGILTWEQAQERLAKLDASLFYLEEVR